LVILIDCVHSCAGKLLDFLIGENYCLPQLNAKCDKLGKPAVSPGDQRDI
jgi:hypothetical protein